MADIKIMLKEARKFIDDQNFKEAQECCKNILRKDKNNYLALVLLGKSLQDNDQASRAYQRAIACNQDHPLAWQGLAVFYERKHNLEDKKQLLSIYYKILNLQIDDEKAIEIITKLGPLANSLKCDYSIGFLANYIKNNSNVKLTELAEKHFIELLTAEVPFKDDDITIILEMLNKIRSNNPSGSVELLIAKVILQKTEFISAVKQVFKLSFFDENVVLREWLCKFLCEKYVEKKSFCGLDIVHNFIRISKGIENSKYPGLLKSIINYDTCNYLEAYKLCVPLINYQEVDLNEVLIILMCTMKLKKWQTAQKLATHFLIKTKDERLKMELKKILFLSLAKQKKWCQAITVSKDIPSDVFNVDEQAILALCYIHTEGKAEHLIDNIQTTDHYVQLKAVQLLNQNQISETITLLLKAPENFMNLFYLGKAYWKLEHYEECYLTLLKSAKLNSEHAETFLFLGHIYSKYKQDFEKAKKCYEKAYNLDNNEAEIIKSLSETYSILDLREIDFNLLRKAADDIDPAETWVQFRLGLHYLRKREWDNAIINFRSVIKVNHNDIVAFECLADVYFSRGSFTSALRAYNKVMTLDPSKSCHCLTRIAYIYSLLTQYEDAIKTFEKVLNIIPDSLLALKGIAETWMRIANKKVSAKMYGSGRDCAQKAIEYLCNALLLQKKYKCLWKLLADALIFITHLPSKFGFVDMLSLNEPQKEKERKENGDIIGQAIACYSHLAKLKQEFVSFDLAYSYLALHLQSKKQVHCHIAYNLALGCIKSKPSDWRGWNLLGKICLFLKKYSLAQHCLIKALMVTRKWSVAKIWCNLGSLYLKLKLFKVANYCFWRGQSNLPSHPHSWIGQALIAEAIREEEAMDLLRHASRLGYHPESALGYADWVCRTLKNNNDDYEFKYIINSLHAIQHAIDLIEWFSIFEPNNPCACTILGILQERTGLLNSAYKSYEKALLYAEDDKRNIALLNMARISMRMEQYDTAIKIYKSITEACLNSACGLALALYKKGLFEESYAAYDTALQWLSNEGDEKADLLVAMAGIVYMFKGQDDAKTLLFHSIQVSQSKPTAYSLFAICSLGFVHSDQNLSRLALSELQKYQTDNNVASDIGFLKSYLPALQENYDEAIKILCNSIHNHPNNILLWYYTAQYCLMAGNNKTRISSCCAQRALFSSGYNDCKCNPAKILAIASIAEYLSGRCMKSLILAKQGLHLYPNEPNIWAAILFLLLPSKTGIEKGKNWMLAAARQMRRHLNTSRVLSRWVSIIEKKLASST